MDQAKKQTADIAQPAQQPADVIISPDTLRANRVPLGQSRTLKWTIFDVFGASTVDEINWNLNVFGLVNAPSSSTGKSSTNYPF